MGETNYENIKNEKFLVDAKISMNVKVEKSNVASRRHVLIS